MARCQELEQLHEDLMINTILLSIVRTASKPRQKRGIHPHFKMTLLHQGKPSGRWPHPIDMFWFSGNRVYFDNLTVFPPSTNIELLVQRKKRVPILAGMVCVEVWVRHVQAFDPIICH